MWRESSRVETYCHKSPYSDMLIFRLQEELEHVLTNSHLTKKSSQDEELASPSICEL